MKIPSKHIKDLTGKKFGKLIVIEYAGNDKHNNSLWKCNCSCGIQNVIVPGHLLRTGKKKKCGCVKNLIGRKFGRLTVISSIKNKNGSISWVCECSCKEKNRIVVSILRLLHGKRRSCGCLKKHNPKIGEVFGRLTVIKKIEPGPSGVARVLCKCTCNKYKKVIYANLISGNVQSCGCLAKELKSKDLTGQKFGKLTVIRKVGKTKYNRILWECTCNCSGKKIITASINLLNGSTKSCGCLRIERLKEAISLPPGEAGFTELFNQYRKRAEKKKFKFTLTKSQFRELTKQNCFYCDAPPDHQFYTKASTKYIGNGIDRLDNLLGYTISNCISSCRVCNMAKSNMAPQEFLDWLKGITKNVDKIERKFQERELLDPQNDS